MLTVLITQKIIVNREGRSRFSEVMDVFMEYIVLMVSQVSNYFQTHQVVYNKFLYFDNYSTIK